MPLKLGLVGLCTSHPASWGPIIRELEPELTAFATKMSWRNNRKEIFLDDLPLDFSGYDGTQFALEYRRSKMGQ